MPAIPNKTEFTGASVSETQFKAALETLHDYLTGLLGSDGTVAAAQFVDKTTPTDAGGNAVWTEGNLAFSLVGTTLTITTS